uniref:NYN domain-containing protein n=1 Tax=Rhizophagus irregularis (strain DAOM 181602 / DAOM 197198 / MUCL 43194) TaxID=747089 RepID=U9SR69_RHIID
MSKLYEAINLLDSAEERTALRIFFTNTEKRTEAESILLTCKDNKEVVAYFKGFLKSELPGTAESVYIFIDNSKLYIQGKKKVAECESLYENMVQIDYGKLVEMGQNERHMGANPIIIGSCPPPEDTLWNSLRRLGYNVTVYDQNFLNEEKEVNSEMVRNILRTVYRNIPGTVILFTGDGDYGPAIREALDNNWTIEIYMVLVDW